MPDATGPSTPDVEEQLLDIEVTPTFTAAAAEPAAPDAVVDIAEELLAGRPPWAADAPVSPVEELVVSDQPAGDAGAPGRRDSTSPPASASGAIQGARAVPRLAPQPRGPRNGPGRGPEPTPAAVPGGPADAARGPLGPGRDRAGCTAPQLKRFIKSRVYVPMHELRRRFQIDGADDDVTPIRVGGEQLYIGLPDREGRLLGELLRGGDVGYELSMDPPTPIVVGLYPMRPIPRP